MISLIGLNKAAVLAALYNAARPQGLGFLQYDPSPMSKEKAQEIIEEQEAWYHSQGYETASLYFDYLKGRVMKTDLSGDTLDTSGYNWDNGVDTAEAVIKSLREGKPSDGLLVSSLHAQGKAEAIKAVRKAMGKKSVWSKEGNVAVLELGLDDVADQLRPAVDAADEEEANMI